MCTLSWWFSDESRGVLFNRDEKRTRSHGLQPEIRNSSDGQRKILMPSDADAGGTWIGVNQSGLIVALLNNYPLHQSEIDGQISRGLLVSGILETADATKESIHLLNTMKMSVYKGFLIFFMDLNKAPEAFEWDGKAITSLNLQAPEKSKFLTSSSRMTGECKRFREKLFARIPPERTALLKAHTFYNNDNPAYGPLMARSDAWTQSITEIQLSPEHATMRFTNVTDKPPILEKSHDFELKLAR